MNELKFNDSSLGIRRGQCRDGNVFAFAGCAILSFLKNLAEAEFPDFHRGVSRGSLWFSSSNLFDTKQHTID